MVENIDRHQVWKAALC